MNKVVVGMSGGVDSSVAAAVLKEQGYEVIGVTMKLWKGEQADDCSPSAVQDAKRVADKLGIEHHVFTFEEAFEQHVVTPFVQQYQMGLTPNPCVMCNHHIKFGVLMEQALRMGADFVATGHYAKVGHQEGRYYLQRASDVKKDQTYFLYRLTQQQLRHTLMPLWDVSKEQTRGIAAQLGLDVAQKKDSQEICFIPDGDYAGLIKRRLGPLPEGDFVDATGRVLGRHKGIVHYTVGQRKGLGIALGYPAYVTKIDAATNRVVLGAEGSQMADRLRADRLTFIPFDTPSEPFRCTAKIRHNAKEAPCLVVPDETGVTVLFDEPQRAIAPGQSVVFYEEQMVLGGGIICA